MKKQLIVLGFLFATIGAALIVFSVVSRGAPSTSKEPSEFDWEMVSRKDFPAPDGRHVATVFEMCCYCTTGDFPQLTLRKPEEKIGDVGNVLSLGPAGEIKVQWLSSTNLAVEWHNWEKRTLPATTNVDGVTITFKRLTREEFLESIPQSSSN